MDTTDRLWSAWSVAFPWILCACLLTAILIVIVGSFQVAREPESRMSSVPCCFGGRAFLKLTFEGGEQLLMPRAVEGCWPRDEQCYP